MSAPTGTAPALVIREASDAEADAIIALIDLCWSAYPGIVLDVDRDEPELRRIASHFRDHGGMFWTAWRGPRLCGTIGYTPLGERTIELRKLYVHPDERRSGLGRRLTALVEAAASALGVARIELWSDTRFETAHRFYINLGYTQTGETRDLDDVSRSTEYQFVRLVAP